MKEKLAAAGLTIGQYVSLLWCENQAAKTGKPGFDVEKFGAIANAVDAEIDRTLAEVRDAALTGSANLDITFDFGDTIDIALRDYGS